MTTTAAVPDPDVSSPVWIRFGEPTKQNRLTIFFRLILLIPQYIVVYLLRIVLFFAGIVGWFAALVTGKLPEGLAFFITGVIRWEARVFAYGLLLNDRYPPFSLESNPEYPVDVAIQSGKLNRLAVLFRIILVIPAAVLSALLLYGVGVFSIILWIVALVMGELPPAFFGAAAAAIRFQIRVDGYFLMVTSYYPGKLMGDRDAGAPPAPPAPPSPDAGGDAGGDVGTAPAGAPSPWELALTSGARVMVVILVVLGLAAAGGYGAVLAAGSNTPSTINAIDNAIGTTVTLQDAQSAYSSVSRSATTFGNSVQSCGASLQCVQASAASFAAALNTYATKVGDLTVPASARAKQEAAVQAAHQAAAEVSSLTTASSYEALAQQISASQFQSTLSAVDSTFSSFQLAVANG
jgi:hypothetical protein